MKNIQPGTRIRALSLLALCSAATLQAEVLVSYDMEAADITAPSVTHSNVTAMNLTVAGSHVQQAGKIQLSGDLADDYSAWNTTTDNGTDVAGALAANSYFELTVTPDAEKAVTISSITFDAVAATAGPSERSIYVFSGETGYVDGSELLTASTTAGSPLIPYNTASVGSSYSIDLSGNSAFSNIASSVTFRFYIQTPGTWQSLAFDDIIVNGSVDDSTVIPEVVLVSYDMQETDGVSISAPTYTDASIISTNLYPAGSHVEQAGKIQLSGDLADDFSAWRTVVDNGTDLDEAIAAAAYFTLSFTPVDGKAVTVTSLSFDAVAATGGPSERSIYVMSSRVGSYTNGNELLTASTTSGSPLIPYNSAAFGQNYTIDLSGNSAFSNIIETVFFRLYIQTPGTHQSLAFDDIEAKGIISIPPVPPVGTIALTVDSVDAVVSWNGVSVASYSVQSNLNLVTESWGTTESNLTGITGIMYSTNSTAAVECFYRVILED